ncbi:uncharacterized protein LOC100883345 [Megachile rotundata]|uniref:uncharacterized protein LOC100883345 n=1 Tax=Megachile rotundata TaxID=143995 RepID=UPI000258F8E1|nr:PREDICTED: uncharacterized protein LOC100883345 [Megachile rotundata]
MNKKIFGALLRSEHAKALLERRYALPQIFCISKYNTDKKNKSDYDDELDKPIKFSTSKAATWPAGFSSDKHLDRPTYQSEIIALSLIVFYVYFTMLREENDIDEKMVENIPVEILEQVYGKNATKAK